MCRLCPEPQEGKWAWSCYAETENEHNTHLWALPLAAPAVLGPTGRDPAHGTNFKRTSKGSQGDLQVTLWGLCCISPSARCFSASAQSELFCVGRKASRCYREVLRPQPVPKYLHRKEDPARLPTFRTSFSETTVGGVGIAEEGLPCPKAGSPHPMATPSSWHQLVWPPWMLLRQRQGQREPTEASPEDTTAMMAGTP